MIYIAPGAPGKTNRKEGKVFIYIIMGRRVLVN